MSLTPQRPFIPPSSSRGRAPVSAETPFHLTPPFVHGRVVAAASIESTVPPIEDFLAMAEEHGSERNAFDYSRPSDTVADELPPIEHFTDPLPLVDRFAPAEEMATGASDSDVDAMYYGGTDSSGFATEHAEAATTEESGWVDSGWQQFDWNGAAALGDASDPAATDEWSRTDWDASPPPRETRETAAQAIARALDQIAERIRNGELLVPPPEVVSDPASIAATLAAILGVRR